MLQPEILAIGALTLLAYGLWRRDAGKTDLRFTELPDLFDGRSFVIKPCPAPTLPGAQKSVEGRSGETSIVYHTTRLENMFAEAVQIVCPKKYALCITLQNGKVQSIQYDGRGAVLGPMLSEGEAAGLKDFMANVRERFSTV